MRGSAPDRQLCTCGVGMQIGISAPQGCGKTTLVTELEKLLEHEGLLCAAVSIDDFYLTNADQNSLAEAHKDNWLLQGRGHAGTHDVALGTKTLQELTTSRYGITLCDMLANTMRTCAFQLCACMNMQALGLVFIILHLLCTPLLAYSSLCVFVCSGTVRVPRYDKSAFGGAGDRAELEKWHTVTPPLSVVLFEGWMLGFRPVGETTAAAVEASLPEVDRRLGSYQAAWDAFAHAWLVVEIEDAAWVFNWRLEAEQKMKEAGKDGMSDEEVHAFVARYMPAYKAYLPQLYAKGPTTAQPGRTLFIQVDEKRCLVGGRTLQ